MSGTELPDHLSEGPTIDEASFILSGYSTEEVTRIHQAVVELTGELDQQENGGTRYLILGNYDENPKKRLQGVRKLVEYFGTNAVAYLLSDLDSENESWDNFYIKFRYTLSLIDYSILVAEDNDGGHELEVGEVTLSQLYVLKRSYGDASIEEDLEYEKFDAMIAKLFELMETNNQLYRWQSLHGLARGTELIVNQTVDSSSDAEGSESSQKRPSEDESVEEAHTADVGQLPSPWTVEKRKTTLLLPNGVEYEVDELRENPPDLAEFDEQTLINSIPDYIIKHLEGDVLEEMSEEEIYSHLLPEQDGHNWITYTRKEENDSNFNICVDSMMDSLEDGFLLEVHGRNADKNHIVKPLATELSFSDAAKYALQFAIAYEADRQQSADRNIAFERTIDEVEQLIDSDT